MTCVQSVQTHAAYQCVLQSLCLDWCWLRGWRIWSQPPSSDSLACGSFTRQILLYKNDEVRLPQWKLKTLLPQLFCPSSCMFGWGGRHCYQQIDIHSTVSSKIDDPCGESLHGCHRPSTTTTWWFCGQARHTFFLYTWPQLSTAHPRWYGDDSCDLKYDSSPDTHKAGKVLDLITTFTPL